MTQAALKAAAVFLLPDNYTPVFCQLEGGDPLYLFAATGQGVQTVGRVNLSLNFSGLIIPFTFLVLSELQPKILIGTNFLQYSKATIDFEHNTIYLAENLVSSF